MKPIAIAASIAFGVIVAIFGAIVKQPLLAIFGVMLPFVVTGALSPILRRLAIRNATRRPKETLLILLGSLLGTAIVTSSGIVGDTSAASIRNTIYTQLGPVDMFVETSDVKQVPVLENVAKTLPRTNVDGVLMIKSTDASVGTDGKDPKAIADAKIIEVPFEDAVKFGDDPKATGIEGPSPKEGVVIAKDVANALGVKKGSEIDLYLLGQKQTVKVERVLDQLGIAGLNIETGKGKSYNIFVPLGMLDAKEKELGGLVSTPISRILLVSNKGDVLGGKKLSKEVTDDLNKILPKPVTPLPGQTIENELKVDSVKESRLNSAALVGKILSGLFLGIGSFTILSGILLLINITSMIAQERQGELGMLRAIGMKRTSLVGAFTLEGFLYSIGSSILGVFVGVILGRVVVSAANGIFNKSDVDYALIYSATFKTLTWGFLGGFTISVFTIFLSSILIARMNVIRAIRELPDKEFSKAKTLHLILGVSLTGLGFLITLVGLFKKNAPCMLIGPALMASGGIFLVKGRVPTKLAITIASSAMIAWSIGAFALFKKIFGNAGLEVYIIQGLQLTVFAVVFVSVNQEYISGAFRRFGGKNWGMIVRLGLAYPLARRSRTGLLLAMYSLVIFVLTLIVTISHVLTKNIDETVQAKARGADIEIVASGDYSESLSEAPFPLEEIKKNSKVDKVAPVVDFFFKIKSEDGKREGSVDAYVVTDAFTGNGSPKLIEFDSKYKTEEEATKAALVDPNVIIVRDTVLRSNGDKTGFKPGEKVLLSDEDGRSNKVMTIAAISSGGPEIVAGTNAISSMYNPEDFGVTRVFVKVKDGVNATVFARQLSGLYVEDDIVARTIRDSVAEGFSLLQQFLRLIQGYLAVGLCVGIAGLGVVMVRAVRERRRQIGMLRAIGFSSKSVQFSFLAESALVALEGILIGVVLALVVLDRILNALGTSGLELTIPWSQITLLVGLTFGASIIATLGPARSASMIPPAAALRITD